MFVITGATGRTGAVAAKLLLDGGHDLRVVVRSETAGQGAEAAIADYLHETALINAFNGADHAYVMARPWPMQPICWPPARQSRPIC